MIRVLRRLVDAVRRRLAPQPFSVPVPPPARIVYPRAMERADSLPPNTVALMFRGASNVTVVHAAFAIGQWCGEHNMNAVLLTPGNGTIQVQFQSDEEEMMFRLAWNDEIKRRSNS